MSVYRPHKFQIEFHASKAKIRAAVAGRNSGKSVMGVNECLAAAINGLKGQLPVPNYGVMISPNNQMLLDDLVPIIDEYIDMSLVKNKFKQKIVFKNGSSIILRSGHRPDSLRGIHPHWIYFDEAAYLEDSKLFDSMLMALQPEGKIWLTSTPKGFNWLYNKVVSHALSGKQVGHGWVSEDGKYFAIRWSTFDNPYHSDEVVSVIERSVIDDKFKRQELYADFVAYEGTIYDFKESEIVAKECPKSYTDVVIGVDVGFAHPTVFEVGVLHNNTWYVVEEVVVKGKTASQLADIGVKLAEKYGAFARFYMSHERPEIRKEFASRGLRTFMADHNIEYGIGLVKDAFQYGELRICKAPKFLEEIKSYRYENGKVVKVDDDACDAIRYLVSGMRRPTHAKIIVPKLQRFNFERSKEIW